MKLDVEGLREQIESESGLKFDGAGDKQDSEKVLDMIGAKFSTFQALRGANRAEIKSVASKYMGLPITDIIQEQRKAENLLEDAEKRLEDFMDSQHRKALKRFKGRMTEQDQERHAEEYIKSYVVGSYAREDEDPAAYEAHKAYEDLRSEIAKLRTEKNAVLLAKDAFIDENKDIIEEERRQARLRDIRKSGLLKELGIAEEEKEKPKEGSEADEGSI